MGSEFQIIFRTLAILALVANILFLIISVPWIIENYDPQSKMPRMRLELYVVVHMFLSGFFVSYIFYEGFRNRQIKYFSITFSIIGIALLLLGSLINVPYSSTMEVRSDVSWDSTEDFSNDLHSEKNPVYGNGSLRPIPISPNSSEIYTWNWVPRESNSSIIQIDIDTTGPIIFTMSEPRYIFFNRTLHWYWFEESLDFDWITYFWTFPHWYMNEIRFEFRNPSDREVMTSFRVTVFYFKATKQVEEIYYDTLLDQNYAYGGLVLLGVSVVLTTLFPMKSKSNLNPKNP